MSVVVPFPGVSLGTRGIQRKRGGAAIDAIHSVRGGSVISWVCPASCACCGRPTLAGRPGQQHVTLCGHCSPPSVA